MKLHYAFIRGMVFAFAFSFLPATTVWAYTFDPGSSQGVMAVFRPGNWKISTALSAGFRAGFSQSGERGRANLAITAYFEHQFFGEGWKPFSTMYSNLDDPTGLKVGVAAHWQTGGHTGDTDSLDLLYASTDVVAEGKGWTTLGQFTFTHSKVGEGFGVETGKTFNDMGIVIQGGKLVTRRIELFVRYDHVIPDGKVRDPGHLGGTGTDHFRTLTGGINLLALADKSLGRTTLDFQYAFDAQSTSIVPTALNAGIFESDGPQWTIRLQWVTSL